MANGTLERILYLEDEPDIQTIAQLALETIGQFTVEACSSGAEAIEKAENFAPDLMLLDVMLPDMDGPTTLSELRKLSRTAETPAVFMTAKVQSQEVEAFKAMGALDVIAKPFNPATLADQLKDIWNNRDQQ